MKNKFGIIYLALLLMLTGCAGKRAVEGSVNEGDVGSSDSSIGSSDVEEPSEIVGDGLYERFLRNEVKVQIGEENNLGYYFNFTESRGQEFTLEELVNSIIKGYIGEETEGVHISLEGIEYAFLDCGNDGNRELAIRIKTPSIDDWTESIIIKEKDGKLKTIYSDVGWSRSRICINEYGYIYGDGSGGASCHGYDKAFLDAEGKYHYIYRDSAEYYSTPYVSFDFYFDEEDDATPVTVWAMIDETHEYDDNDDYEFYHGYKGYTGSSIIHDDSLYEKSGKIYEYLEQRDILPEEKLLTINEVEQMIAEKEKQEGLTEEIKSGKTLEWEELKYTFEPVVSVLNSDNILGIKEYFPLGFMLLSDHDGDSYFSLNRKGEISGRYDYYIFPDESADGESYNYENEFSGNLKVEEKVNNHIYKLKLSDYAMKYKPGTVYMDKDNKILANYVDVPGLGDGGEHYILYTPGTKVSEIDEKALNQLNEYFREDKFDGDVLNTYLLYETDGENNVWM